MTFENQALALFERIAVGLEKTNEYVEQQNRLPMLFEEYNSDLTGNATTLLVTSVSSNVVLVECVTTAIPPGQTGILTLGDRRLPVGAGVTNLELGVILGPTDTRQLVSTGAGNIALWISGHIYSRITQYR